MIIKTVRQVAILLAGSAVILLGIAGLVLPVIPGMVVIPVGLAILATEFVWARRLLKQMKKKANDALDMVRGTSGPPPKQ